MYFAVFVLLMIAHLGIIRYFGRRHERLKKEGRLDDPAAVRETIRFARIMALVMSVIGLAATVPLLIAVEETTQRVGLIAMAIIFCGGPWVVYWAVKSQFEGELSETKPDKDVSE